MATTDILLAPGENGLHGRTFRPNLVLFWLRSNILVTNRRLAVNAPNTILGVIPLGNEERSMPIGAIAGVTSSLSVKAGRLVIFGILALVFLFSFFGMVGDDPAVALFFLLVAVVFGAMAANAVVAKLTITNNGGGTSEVTVSALEKAGLDEFKSRANEIIYSAGPAGQSWSQAQMQGNMGHPLEQVNQQQWSTQAPRTAYQEGPVAPAQPHGGFDTYRGQVADANTSQPPYGQQGYGQHYGQQDSGDTQP